MDTTAPQTRTLNAIRTRRALDLGFNGVFWAVFLLVVFLAYGSVPNNYYQVLMVNSGSMSPTIEAGDLIVVTKPPEELRSGMVLTMVVNGGIVTHRLVDIDADGQMITKGDANEVNDQWESADISVRGLYRFRIPKLGLLLNGPMQWLRGTVSGSWFTDADEVAFAIGAAWNTATPTATPEPTDPPADPGCTRSHGYWKTHPEEWPVDEMILGDQTYTFDELMALLNKEDGNDKGNNQGNKNTIDNLIIQLIAAKLNVADGADPSAVADVIVEADEFLILYPPGSTVEGDDKDRIEVLKDQLDRYNNGKIGPGKCRNEEKEGDGEPAVEMVPTETPTPTPTLTPTETPTETEEVDAPVSGEGAPEDTATPTITPTATEEVAEGDGLPVEASPEPTATDTPEPTATDTLEPTATDTPEPLPTDTPEPEPTETSEPVATEVTESTEG